MTKICKLLHTFLLQILKDLADSGRPFRSQLSSCKDCGGSYSTLKVLSCLCFPSQTEVNAVKKRRNTQSKRKLNCPAKIKLRDILAFPQFKVRLPFEMENELVHAILNNKSITSTSFLQPTLSNLYCLPASWLLLVLHVLLANSKRDKCIFICFVLTFSYCRGTGFKPDLHVLVSLMVSWIACKYC